MEKINRKVWALALPALGSLLVEPLLTLMDSVFAAWLNTATLAGLSVSTTFLNFTVGICVFLAYSTTAITGRLVGSGKNRQALEKGIQIFWLALILGIMLAVILFFLAKPLFSFYTADKEVVGNASIYFGISLCGLPAMLGYLAINGLMRGFGNTKIPFYISLFAVVINIPFSYVLTFPLQQGIAGIALGTVISQWLSLFISIKIVHRQAQKYQAALKINLSQIKTNGLEGMPLVLRSLFLQASVVITVYVAGFSGKEGLASYQVTKTIWIISAYALDALAIAAQTLIAQALGEAESKTLKTKDSRKSHSLVRFLIIWGSICGIIIGLVIMAGANYIPNLFSLAEETRWITVLSLIIMALLQPLAGLVYLVDGILIGAGKNWELAKGYGLVLLFYAPIVYLSTWWIDNNIYGLLLVWAMYGIGFFGLRALVFLKATIAIGQKI